MIHSIKRRDFICGAAAACAAGCCTTQSSEPEGPAWEPPFEDLHVHLDNSTIDAVVELSRERSVKFGIVEHAGDRENVYPTVLSNDEELAAYIAMLDGKPVYKGVQAEWHNWFECFSPAALARLDFILTDAMTYPNKEGKRHKLWEPGFDIDQPEVFMDAYAEWYIRILEEQPIDVLANVSWLPEPLGKQYEHLWTDRRIECVVETAVKYGTAIEISSGFELPKRRFLEIAREAGAKFCFGTNGRYPKMGLLDYSVNMARQLNLTRADLFSPAPEGRRAVDRWLARRKDALG